MFVSKRLGYSAFALVLLSLWLISIALEKEEVISVQFDSDIYPVSPIDAPGQDWGKVKSQVFETLFLTSSDGRLTPQLVESWSVNDDFTHFNFSLKKGILFSDGSELDADDIMYTLEKAKSLEADTLTAYVFKLINKIEKTDVYNFEIFLNKPYYEFLVFLASRSSLIFPMGIFENKTDKLSHWVGTGPYQLETMNGNSIILKPNPYYRSSIRFEKISFKKSSNPKQDLDNGILDFVGISRDQVDRYQNDEKYLVSSFPMHGSFFLGFNMKNTIVQDLNLRKAIYFGLDRSKMVEGVSINPEFIPAGIVPYGLLGYQSSGYTYNVDTARKYLNKASKLPNEITLLIPRNPHAMAIYAAERIKKDLAILGLKVKTIMVQDKFNKGKLGDFYQYLRGPSDYFMYLRGMITTTPSTLQVYEQVFLKSSPMNLGDYSSENIDRAFSSRPQSLLDSDLQKYYFSLNKILQDELPVIPLGILYQNRLFRADKPFTLNAISPYMLRLNDIP